ncbi:unnamed protein product, partial [Amoebophrya sp. A120]
FVPAHLKFNDKFLLSLLKATHEDAFRETLVSKSRSPAGRDVASATAVPSPTAKVPEAEPHGNQEVELFSEISYYNYRQGILAAVASIADPENRPQTHGVAESDVPIDDELRPAGALSGAPHVVQTIQNNMTEEVLVVPSAQARELQLQALHRLLPPVESFPNTKKQLTDSNEWTTDNQYLQQILTPREQQGVRKSMLPVWLYLLAVRLELDVEKFRHSVSSGSSRGRAWERGWERGRAAGAGRPFRPCCAIASWT